MASCACTVGLRSVDRPSIRQRLKPTSSTIRIRYADAGDAYATWSASVSVASGVASDDIGAIAAFGGKVGVFWSNQVSQRYGFSYHFDSDDPAAWSGKQMEASNATCSRD